jgi:hypothetical protein
MDTFRPMRVSSSESPRSLEFGSRSRHPGHNRYLRMAATRTEQTKSKPGQREVNLMEIQLFGLLVCLPQRFCFR